MLLNDIFFSSFTLSLKDQEAPFSLSRTNFPLAMVLFKYFLMNGANLSASSLYGDVFFEGLKGWSVPFLKFLDGSIHHVSSWWITWFGLWLLLLRGSSLLRCGKRSMAGAADLTMSVLKVECHAGARTGKKDRLALVFAYTRFSKENNNFRNFNSATLGI